MRTRRAEASSPNSDPQYFWNEYLQKWTDLGVNCIAEAQLPLCQEKPSMENFKKDSITKLNIDLRADLLKTWTEQEKELFTQRFIEVGKDFSLIADALPRKLRKKAIDEKNGAKTRRAKSCGNGKGTKRRSQRLENAVKITKERLRKTYSCPEANTLESKEMFGDIKSKANEGGHSSKHLEHTEKITENDFKRLNDYRKGPSTKVGADINQDSVDTREKELTRSVNRRKGSTKLSITCDQWSDMTRCVTSQETSVKPTKASGLTPRVIEAKRPKGDPSNDGKHKKKTCIRREGNNNDSTNGVIPITGGDSTLAHSSNYRKMGNVHTGSSQDKVGSANAQAFRSRLVYADRKNKRKDSCKRTTKVIDKITHGSYENDVLNGTSSTGAKGHARKRSSIKDIRAHIAERKRLKKLKTKPFDKRLFVKCASKVTKEVKIKNAKNSITDNSCDATEGKSIVKTVSDPEYRCHFSNGGKVKKLKQKRQGVDARMKSSKKQSKRDAGGHSSGCGSELSEDYGEGKSRKRNSNILKRAAGVSSEKRKKRVLKRQHSAAKHKNNDDNLLKSTAKNQSPPDDEIPFTFGKEIGQKNRRQSVKPIKGSSDVGSNSATVQTDGIFTTVNYDDQTDEESCSDDDCRITYVKRNLLVHCVKKRQQLIREIATDLAKFSPANSTRDI
ncbi:hypothetical protein ACROYT_G008480 [Oculina patagonica]